jgi:NAD-dependent deacetylase sirtuin 5
LPAFRENIAPGTTFTLITQNVDGLSTRALASVKSSLGDAPIDDQAEPVILEMHGRLSDVVCTAQECGYVQANFDSPICPALAGTEAVVDAGATEPVIPLADLPRCTKCGAPVRPGVVWFGERPQHLNEIGALVEKADLCLVIGTSSLVHSRYLFYLPLQPQ